MPRYLQKRRRRWYAVLEVPKALRDQFGPRLVKSLETESLTEAERKVLSVVAHWKAEFEAARSDSKQPLEALAREWNRDLDRASEDKELRSIYQDILEDKVRKIERHDPVSAENFRQLVTGDTIELAAELDDWVASLTNVAKSIDMKRSDVTVFLKTFPYSHQVTKRSVERWIYDLQQEKGIKPTTARRYIASCRDFWKYLNRSGRIDRDDDCFSGVVDMRSTNTKASWSSTRKAFTATNVVNLWEAASSKGDAPLVE
ncbi:MAG: DUF6538 domain-containing protein [Pseudomonadota bacterium]|nr:DUF6538 domain-containing protein [Pseudomonadota bacterium]